MDKLTELKAMADNLGLTIESVGTDSKEEFCIYKGGVEIAKGSYDVMKVKLEDMLYERDMDAKIKALVDEGKTDTEIIKIMSDYPLPEGGPMPQDLISSSAVQSALETLAENVVEYLNTEHKLEFTDLAIDELRKVVGDTIASWYEKSMSEKE